MTNLTIPINYDLLRATCLADITDFAALPGFTTHATQNGIYYFRDNGSNVLAVAHLDSVQDTDHFHKIDIKGKDYVFNAQLDDRLGAYTILHLLPSLGVKYDILLTEGEELGLSTAQYFTPPEGRQYNWMFSFDRRLDDVVMYQYDCKFARKKLKEADLKPGYGSFSDIDYLDHLKCIGFNFGVGYDNEHSAWAIMHVDIFQEQIKKFVKFYNLNKNLYMFYTPKPRAAYHWRGDTIVRGGDKWTDDEYPWEWNTKTQRWMPAASRASVSANEEFYKTHKWDTKLLKYVPIEKANVEVCEICGRPPRDEMSAVYFGSQLICDQCLPHAAQCGVCGAYVSDETLLDGICYDCVAEINAGLDEDRPFK